MSESTLRILVVDDEPDLREVLRFFLEDSGFIVEESHSGNDAFKKVQQQKFDLVVSDVRMADGTGIELLNNIQTLGASKPPVILVTGFADTTPEEAVAMGARAMLPKPLKFGVLFEAVEKVLKSPPLAS